MFSFELELLSEDGLLAANDVLCEPMTVRLELPDDKERYFHGYVSRFCMAEPAGRLFRYRATLRPWLWFLTRISDCQIFQNMKAPDIIMQVCRDAGFTDFEDALSGSYASLEYCVQYRETDFNFISRLMEQEGIYYYVKHEKGKHTVVFSDAYDSHQPASGFAEIPYFPSDYHGAKPDHIDQWIAWKEAQPNQYALNDFDYLKPSANLRVSSLTAADHSVKGSEVYDYPGQYIVAANGENYSRVRIEELHAQAEQAQGSGNVRGIAVGSLFSLTDFPRNDQNREYLIVSAQYELQSDEFETNRSGPVEVNHCSFNAIESKKSFRPARVTPKPIVQGPQTAIVVGKSGEEIWTDEHGRVKVQFHWDRYGKNDENSSCWVRVSQGWAGNKWGAIQLPRMGQEVIVDFLEGDPDRPIITGRVYNGEQATPVKLPADKTQSTVKSRSSKKGNENTFNELRFEDKKDEEHIYFHAEKDFERIVENNDKHKIGFDKKDKGDQTIEVFNNQEVTIGCKDASDGSQTIEIWKDRSRTVKEGDDTTKIEKGKRSVTVKKDDTHQVQDGNRVVKVDKGDDTVTIAQGDRTVKANAGAITIQAAKSILLKVGGSSIKIEPAKITITSAQIAIKGQAKVEVAAAQVAVKGQAQLDLQGAIAQLKGSGMTMIQGGLVKIN